MHAGYGCFLQTYIAGIFKRVDKEDVFLDIHDNYGKKKANNLFVNVSHPSNEKNIAKSMTILKICERSFK